MRIALCLCNSVCTARLLDSFVIQHISSSVLGSQGLCVTRRAVSYKQTQRNLTAAGPYYKLIIQRGHSGDVVLYAMLLCATLQ